MIVKVFATIINFISLLSLVVIRVKFQKEQPSHHTTLCEAMLYICIWSMRIMKNCMRRWRHKLRLNTKTSSPDCKASRSSLLKSKSKHYHLNSEMAVLREFWISCASCVHLFIQSFHRTESEITEGICYFDIEIHRNIKKVGNRLSHQKQGMVPNRARQ